MKIRKIDTIYMREKFMGHDNMSYRNSFEARTKEKRE